MKEDYGFTQEGMEISPNLGYPKAYAKLCHDRGFRIFNHGPPFTFTPYTLEQDEASGAREFDGFFPVIDPKAKPTAKPKLLVGLLWKQLNHLGAGFDPAVIRVDPYGNVLYYHADSASPLAWDIDHWFPCSRGGLTVASNLRILQWQACKRKHNKLEFLIPWWDFQLGISVNQFLSIFASSNSDFRHRGFSFLFFEGENEELNSSQTVDSHAFPQHFIESKEQVGLAPAAIVRSRKESYDTSVLKQLDYNRRPRSQSPAIVASSKMKPLFKENENLGSVANPYQAIVMVRDSQKIIEDTTRKQLEMQKLSEDVNEMKLSNEEEKLIIQDLELELTKRRRKVEKYRRYAEEQSSYRTMLEKMIRETMHQSVVYKEQIRLNKAASNALKARLEAQKAICYSAEKELHKKYRERDELEKQIRPDWEQTRKRLRMDDSILEERGSNLVLSLPGIRPKTPLHKELRVFLEEEQRASEAGLSQNEDKKQGQIEEELKKRSVNIIERSKCSLLASEDADEIENKFQKLGITEGKKYGISIPVLREPEMDDDEESRKERGKGNVEKWLQMLLENTQEDANLQYSNEDETSRTDEIIKSLNQKYPLDDSKIMKSWNSQDQKKQLQLVQDKNGRLEKEDKTGKEIRKIQIEKRNATDRDVEVVVGEGITVNKSVGMERMEYNGKERKLNTSESARNLRRIPSSPLLLGMRKGVDWIRKKPMVNGDDKVDVNPVTANRLFKSPFKTFKKAVKI